MNSSITIFPRHERRDLCIFSLACLLFEAGLHLVSGAQLVSGESFQESLSGKCRKTFKRFITAVAYIVFPLFLSCSVLPSYLLPAVQIAVLNHGK